MASEVTIRKTLSDQILDKMQEYLKGVQYFDEKYLEKFRRFIDNGNITSEEQLIKILNENGGTE